LGIAVAAGSFKKVIIQLIIKQVEIYQKEEYLPGDKKY